MILQNSHSDRLFRLMRFMIALAPVALLVSSIGPSMGSSAIQAQEESAADPANNRVGHSIQVQLPITSKVATQVRQTISRLAENAPTVVRPEDRMVVVLEFDTSGGRTGRGSELGSCFELARFLSGPELSSLQTIAYVPGPKGYVDPNSRNADAELTSQLNGHAVLVAIATNKIVLHENASIGLAAIDEQAGDQTVEVSYLSIAKRRLTLPVQVVVSMVRADAQLFRVTMGDGSIVFVDAAEFSRLDSAGAVINTETLSKPNELNLFTSKQLRDLRLIGKPVSSKADLARQLNLAPKSLEGDPTLGREWSAVQIPLPEYVNDESAQWVIRALDSRNPNLIIFRLGGRDSDPDACLRLAQKLASYDSSQIRTVAFISQELRGPAALIALTCDHLIMAPEAHLLGKGDTEYDEQTINDFRSLVQELARRKGIDWSMLMATLDQGLTIDRYKHVSTGQVRLLSVEEHKQLNDQSEWLMLGPVPIGEGFSAELAEHLFIASNIRSDMDAVQSFYQLTEPPLLLKPTLADQWLKKVAATLGSPLIAPWLLFGAFFFLSTEMSAPGIGVPGFLGTVCLMLFFWSQYLGGNAHWLEILLFITGVVFLLIEIFAIPGFGIFGIGGLIMVIVSIVLASQTFIIPTNSEQLARLPYSLLPLVGAGLGFGIAIFTLRNVLPHTPYVRRLMLEPRVRNPIEEGFESDPEAIVDWGHLVGRSGETVTRLFPAGKARIAGDVYDVISDGKMIEKGQAIEVAEVAGNRILVRLTETA